MFDRLRTVLKPRIQAETARTESNYLEQAARDGDVFEEMEELIQVRDVAMEEKRRREAVGRDYRRDPTGPIAQRKCRYKNELHRDSDREAELRQRKSG